MLYQRRPYRKRWTPFGVTIEELPITEWSLSLPTGNSDVLTKPLIEGDVTEYEVRSAAKDAHISWQDWLRMDIVDRATVIAHYRVDSLLKVYYKQKEQEAIRAAYNGM